MGQAMAGLAALFLSPVLVPPCFLVVVVVVPLQHLAFQLADMATELQVARLMVRQAASLLDAGDPNARGFCAMAKQVATDNGFKVRLVVSCAGVLSRG
jgi:hypothetical protein